MQTGFPFAPAVLKSIFNMAFRHELVKYQTAIGFPVDLDVFSEWSVGASCLSNQMCSFVLFIELSPLAFALVQGARRLQTQGV